MKHLKVFVFCLASCVIAGAAVAATPEEKAAKEAARAAEKARNEKFNALHKRLSAVLKSVDAQAMRNFRRGHTEGWLKK